MEPHEFDKYIGSKLMEAENAGREGERSGMDRVWATIGPELEKRATYQWLKMAAVIILLLVPSVYLFLRNREQENQIMTLNSKLAIIERNYRQKLQAFTLNQPDNVVIQHDTIRLVKTVEKKIIPATVEMIKYITDTVVIYQQREAARLVEQDEVVTVPDETNQALKQNPVKTEYILSGDTATKKKKKSHSFQIRLGAGSNSVQTAPELAFKTKL